MILTSMEIPGRLGLQYGRKNLWHEPDPLDHLPGLQKYFFR
ncbi:hypothetical protein [Azospirillum doebereinerae]